MIILKIIKYIMFHERGELRSTRLSKLFDALRISYNIAVCFKQLWNVNTVHYNTEHMCSTVYSAYAKLKLAKPNKC